jgi:23S rRNA (cytosine1962-C5)-methyltransferase
MELFFADKPAGVTTHTSLNENQKQKLLIDRCDGFVEAIAARKPELGSLHVVHRLDKETTGAICFARSKADAETLRELFESREVQKRYLFLTDSGISAAEFTRESLIEREGSQFVSHVSANPNARTRFRRLEESHGLSLWEAYPETGKPHQIRLHALDAGIPILGDQAHGGSRFPGLCLHAESIAFEVAGKKYSHSSPPPRWFTNRELADDQRLTGWLHAIDRRERLMRTWGSSSESARQTLRWIHTEGDPLRLEQLGDVFSLSWFKPELPNDSERESITSLMRTLGAEKWYLQVRGNRGSAPHEEEVLQGPSPFSPRWTAEENGLRFEFRTDSGLSPGLFLDQRRNRQWVREHANGKTVLNLFCYTTGFSVAAAAGGASKTVSVDVSKTFLEWGKRNFELNSLDIAPHEFRAMDSREYLAWAKKKGLKFDLIICDPPSFSRSKTGLFRIEKDFESLLTSLLDVLAPQGTLLFASNYEAWSIDDFETRAKKIVSSRKGLNLRATPPADWDFELPHRPSNMKSFFVSFENAVSN